jgi:hypothetical protein
MNRNSGKQISLLANCFNAGILSFYLDPEHEVVCTSETSADSQRIARYCVPEDSALHELSADSFKSYIDFHILRTPASNAVSCTLALLLEVILCSKPEGRGLESRLRE